MSRPTGGPYHVQASRLFGRYGTWLDLTWDEMVLLGEALETATGPDDIPERLWRKLRHAQERQRAQAGEPDLLAGL